MAPYNPMLTSPSTGQQEGIRSDPAYHLPGHTCASGPSDAARLRRLRAAFPVSSASPRPAPTHRRDECSHCRRTRAAYALFAMPSPRSCATAARTRSVISRSSRSVAISASACFAWNASDPACSIT